MGECVDIKMASGVPKAAISHAQRVCRLYKKACRTLYDFHDSPAMLRYNCTMMRARFDETRKEKDMRVLAAMLEEGEEEVWRVQHYQPFQFKLDPGALCYNRYIEPQDAVLDYWHPWERAQYMSYFEKRDQLKEEYNDYYKNVICKKLESKPAAAPV